MRSWFPPENANLGSSQAPPLNQEAARGELLLPESAVVSPEPATSSSFHRCSITAGSDGAALGLLVGLVLGDAAPPPSRAPAPY